MPEYCSCELRNRQWNTNTHRCETCGNLYQTDGEKLREAMLASPLPIEEVKPMVVLDEIQSRILMHDRRHWHHVNDRNTRMLFDMIKHTHDLVLMLDKGLPRDLIKNQFAEVQKHLMCLAAHASIPMSKVLESVNQNSKI